MIDLSKMTTETRNQDTTDLDRMSSLEIVTAMNREDAMIADAVKKVLPEIAGAVDVITRAVEKGGRLLYMGAGTSGRLGVLDASECPPTFGVSPEMVIGMIAGGDTALRNPVEGAEDNEEQGVKDLRSWNLTKDDVVAGIAASGRTPYVIGGLKYANELGCQTIAVTCNARSAMGNTAKIAIEAVPGPEVLTGSTRLKAGSTQKMILNMLTTASMVRMGKAYQNLMVDVVQSNAKLHTRAEDILISATGIEREEARKKIEEAQGSVKAAIVMVLACCGYEEALAKLSQAKGHVRQALEV